MTMDVLAAIKEWQYNEDQILAILSNKIIKRKLLKIEITDTAISKEKFIRNEATCIKPL